MSIKKKIAKKIFGVIKKSKADPRVENVATGGRKSYGTIQRPKTGKNPELERMDDEALRAFRRRNLK